MTTLEIYRNIDRDAHDIFRAIAMSGKPDAAGYVGKYGRDHIGGNRSIGLYLIYGVATEDAAIVDDAFRAIDVYFGEQLNTGAFWPIGPSGYPPGDILASHSMFLAELTHGLLVMEQAMWNGYHERFEALIPKIAKCAEWITGRPDLPYYEQTNESRWTFGIGDDAYTIPGSWVLEDYNRRYANRQFFHACATGFTGLLLGEQPPKAPWRKEGRGWCERGRKMQRTFENGKAAGYFEEAGGYDSSYQAVSLRLFNRFAQWLPPHINNRYNTRLSLGFRWLLSRINPDGSLNLDGNTRVGPDGTDVNKKPDIPSLVMSLLFRAQVTGNASLTETAKRVAGYYGARR